MSRRHTSSTAWLWYGVAAAGVYYALKSSGLLGAAPTPLSIYPEFAYTARTTSMAASPQQKAPAAVTPTPLYQTVQAQEQAAILSQCVGSYPGCTVLMADTQLGL